MTLSPRQDPNYYTQSMSGEVDDSHWLREYMNEVYSKGSTVNQSFWAEADTDYRFYAGDQTVWNDIYGNLSAGRRRQFNFNRIRRVINMITGYQRQHRKSTVAVPQERSDTETADQLSRVLLWSNQNANVYQAISEAFLGAMITGQAFLSSWLDYSRDPINGDLVVDNMAYNSFLVDPYYRKHDLSDCNYLWTRKYVSRKQASLLFPDRSKEIEGMYGRGARDGKFFFLPESYNYASYDLLTLDEFWYLDTRPQKVLIDMKTGETREWYGTEEDLKDFMKQYGKKVEVRTQQIPTVKLGIQLEDLIVYHGKNPLGIDRYPHVGVYGYFTPEISYYPLRCQGIVRSLRDAQYLYNRRRVIELDILESQITGGWKVKENALVDPNDAFLNGQGRRLVLKQEAQMTDAEQIMPPQVPPSMIQLSELLAKEITEISGVNEELLGSAQDDKAGILSMLRQGAGLVTLQQVFDQLDQSQKQLGDLHTAIIQANWRSGKIQRVLNEEPSAMFYERSFPKYDMVVEEGLNTSTQRQMQFLQLLNIREVGVPVPTSVLIDASTLQGKPALLKAIEAEEKKASQMQQQQMQVQMQVLQAQIKDLEAKALANSGLGMERASRMEENKALAIERRAAAIKDIEAANLDQVRAAVEMQGLDIDNLMKFLTLLQSLKQGEEQEAGIQQEMKKPINYQQSQQMGAPQSQAPSPSPSQTTEPQAVSQ